MHNDAVIQEIRALLAEGDSIPPKVRDRLMLAAIADTNDKVVKIMDELSATTTIATETKRIVEKEIPEIQRDVDDNRKRINAWNSINSLGVALVGILASIFGGQR